MKFILINGYKWKIRRKLIGINKHENGANFSQKFLEVCWKPCPK